MKKFMRDVFAEQQRIIVLQGLEADDDLTLNNEMLQRLLDHLGHAISIDRVNSLIRWLEDLDLVEVEELETLLIVKLTRRGQDVAQGRMRIDGIDRPIPLE